MSPYLGFKRSQRTDTSASLRPTFPGPLPSRSLPKTPAIKSLDLLETLFFPLFCPPGQRGPLRFRNKPAWTGWLVSFLPFEDHIGKTGNNVFNVFKFYFLLL